jgi:hypothetical protein
MSEAGGQHPIRNDQLRTHAQRLAALRAAYAPLSAPDARPDIPQVNNDPVPPARTAEGPFAGNATETIPPPSARAAEAAAERGQISLRDRLAAELPPAVQAVTGIASRANPRTQLTAQEVALGPNLPEPRDNRPEWVRRLQENREHARTERNAERNAERVDIIQLFNRVRGEFNPRGPYAVDRSQIPDQIPEAEPFDPQLQFFNRDAPGGGWYANPQVATGAYEDPNAIPLVNTRDPRFRDAEDNVTGGDSGFFALCASAARTPEDQARLFTVLSSAVIRMNLNNPTLIVDWYDAQEAPQHGNPDLTSANLFREHDLARPPAERLFTYDESTNPPTIDIDTFARTQHQDRLRELLTTIANGRVSLNDLRQLELYAHLARVGDMIDDMRRRPIRIAPPTPPPQPPPGSVPAVLPPDNGPADPGARVEPAATPPNSDPLAALPWWNPRRLRRILYSWEPDAPQPPAQPTPVSTDPTAPVSFGPPPDGDNQPIVPQGGRQPATGRPLDDPTRVVRPDELADLLNQARAPDPTIAAAEAELREEERRSGGTNPLAGPERPT